MAQTGEDPALHHLHAGFDLGLVLRLPGSGRQDHGIVVLGELGRGPIEFGLVAAWPGDQGTGIVGNDQGRYAANEFERTAHAGQPVGLGLSRGRTGEGVARSAEHRDEDAGRPDFAGVGIDNRHGRAGIVGEQFLAGPVDLAHRALELAGPVAVAGTEGRVLVAALAGGLTVLFPEQRQGDAFLLQFLMNQRIVRFGKGRFAGGTLPVEQFLQPGIIEGFGNRPGHANGTGQPQVLGDHALGNLERPGNGLKAQTGAVPVSQYVSDLAHG